MFIYGHIKNKSICINTQTRREPETGLSPLALCSRCRTGLFPGVCVCLPLLCVYNLQGSTRGLKAHSFRERGLLQETAFTVLGFNEREGCEQGGVAARLDLCKQMLVCKHSLFSLSLRQKGLQMHLKRKNMHLGAFNR